MLLGIETALYPILTYLEASKTVDFAIEGIEEFTGVTIISPKSDDIRKMIIVKLGRDDQKTVPGQVTIPRLAL